MLLTHLTLTETAKCPKGLEDDPGLLRMAQAQIEVAVDKARDLMYAQLTGRWGTPWHRQGIEPYNTDAGRPYVQTYVTEWQAGGGLDCATEWCEVYKGQGVHVGLVVEGKASGPVYSERAEDGTHVPGVNDGDFDKTVVETFLAHLRTVLAEDVPWFALDPIYVVTDWSFYERCSAEYNLDEHEDLRWMESPSWPQYEDPWWIYIQRQHGADLVVGPYDGQAKADHAMQEAGLIDGFCEEDCLDCFTARQSELATTLTEIRRHEPVIIDPTDPHHTGEEEQEDSPHS